MPPKKKIISEETDETKEVIVSKTVKKKEPKRSVGRPKKSSKVSVNVGKSKRKLNSTQTDSQIIFTRKERKLFYQLLMENGFSAIQDEELLIKTFPNRSISQINSLVEYYSRKAQELNKKSDETTGPESSANGQPIDKWYQIIHQLVPNSIKKDDISAVFADVLKRFVEEFEIKEVKPNSVAIDSELKPNYGEIYRYINQTLEGKYPPELEPINAFVVLKLIEEMKEVFKNDIYHSELSFLMSGKFWELKNQNEKSADDWLNAIQLKRKQQMETNDNEESATTSSTTNDTQDRNEDMNEVLKFPKVKRIDDCLNPLRVPNDLLKDEVYRWQN